MKPNRFTAAFFESRPNKFKQRLIDAVFTISSWLCFILAALAALAILYCFRPAYANPTDWHDDEVSRQIQADARAEARKIWREEHGDWQPNLTPMAEAELVRYTTQKQAEIDRALRGNQ